MEADVEAEALAQILQLDEIECVFKDNVPRFKGKYQHFCTEELYGRGSCRREYCSFSHHPSTLMLIVDGRLKQNYHHATVRKSDARKALLGDPEYHRFLFKFYWSSELAQTALVTDLVGHHDLRSLKIRLNECIVRHEAEVLCRKRELDRQQEQATTKVKEAKRIEKVKRKKREVEETFQIAIDDLHGLLQKPQIKISLDTNQVDTLQTDDQAEKLQIVVAMNELKERAEDDWATALLQHLQGSATGVDLRIVTQTTQFAELCARELRWLRAPYQKKQLKVNKIAESRKLLGDDLQPICEMVLSATRVIYSAPATLRTGGAATSDGTSESPRQQPQALASELFVHAASADPKSANRQELATREGEAAPTSPAITLTQAEHAVIRTHGVRKVVEEVAHPLLGRLFNVLFDKRKCRHCNRQHSANSITTNCILALLPALDDYSARQDVKNVTMRINGIVLPGSNLCNECGGNCACWFRLFAADSVATILLCANEWWGALDPALQIALEECRSVRNEAYHHDLSRKEFDDCVQKLEHTIEVISKALDLNFGTYQQEITAALDRPIRQPVADLIYDGLTRDVSRCSSLDTIQSLDNLGDVARSSHVLGTQISRVDQTVIQILVLGSHCRKARENLKGLGRVQWSVILDPFDTTASWDQCACALIDYNPALGKPDLTKVNKAIRVKNGAHLLGLLPHIGNVQITVVPGAIDSKTEMVWASVQSVLVSFLRLTRSLRIELLLAVESAGQVDHVTDLNKVLTDKIHGVDGSLSNVRFPIVAAVVSAHCQCVKTVVLNSKHGLVGVNTDELNLNKIGFEVLDLHCDEPPTHSVQGSLEDTKKKELVKVFCKGEPMPWFLFRENAYVRRETLSELLAAVRCHASNVMLQHGFGEGGTTLLRLCLYELRHEFLCVNVTSSAVCNREAAMHEAAVQALKKLSDLTDMPLLLLVDYDVVEFAEVVLDSLRTLGVHRPRAISGIHGAGKDNSGAIELRPYTPREKQSLYDLLLTALPAARIFPDVLKDYALENALSIETGQIDWSKTAKLVRKELLQLGDDFLSDRGELYPGEITLLHQYVRDNDHELGDDEDDWRMRTRPDGPENVETHPPVFALIAQFPQMKERALSYLKRLLPTLSENEVKLLRVCVFFSIFAPSQAIDNTTVQLLLGGEPELSAKLKLLLSCRRVQGGSIGWAILLTQQSYLLVNDIKIFGEHIKKMPDVKEFLWQMSNWLKGDSLEKRILRDGLRQPLVTALCNFKIWHGGPHPDNHAQGSFSFLVNLLKHQHQASLAGTIMTWMEELYRPDFSSLVAEGADAEAHDCIKIASQTARFLAYHDYPKTPKMGKKLNSAAGSKLLVPVTLDGGTELPELDGGCKTKMPTLDSFSNSDGGTNAEVEYEFDGIRAAQRIMSYYIYEENTVGRVDVEFCLGTIWRNKMSKLVSAKTKRWNPISHAWQYFGCALEHFEKDLKLSGGQPSACIAWVQTTLTFLTYVNEAMCDGDTAKFMALLEEGGSSTDSVVRDVFDGLRKRKIFDACHAKLRLAEAMSNYPGVQKYDGATRRKTEEKVRKCHRELLGLFDAKKLNPLQVALNTAQQLKSQSRRPEVARIASALSEFFSDVSRICATHAHYIADLSFALTAAAHTHDIENGVIPKISEDQWLTFVERMRHVRKVSAESYMIVVAQSLNAVISHIENGGSKEMLLVLEKQLYEDLQVMTEAAGLFSNNYHVKYFLARTTVVPNNLLTRFLLFDDLPFRADLKGTSSLMNESLYMEHGSDMLTRLQGTIKEDGSQLKTDFGCEHAHLRVPFAKGIARELELKHNDLVDFYVGIRPKGLWAKGVSKRD